VDKQLQTKYVTFIHSFRSIIQNIPCDINKLLSNTIFGTLIAPYQTTLLWKGVTTMEASCKDCLYLKKLPDQMALFCKKDNFQGSLRIWGCEIKSDETIRLSNRKVFKLAKICPAFFNMEDEEEKLRVGSTSD
jgi:hypothetical protein